MTSPVPHWPGRMLALADGTEVWLAETPRSVPAKELVLCVHGMSGGATNWTDLMAELFPDFDCAAVDLPGSGFSPPPLRHSGYSVTSFACVVRQVIEALGAGPVHLIGNSMGGAVAIRAAAGRPDLVKTLTLVSPVLPDWRPTRSRVHFPVLALPVVGELIVSKFSRLPAENRVAGVYSTCYYDPAALHPERFALEVAELRRRDALGYDARSLARAARSLVGETFRPRRISLWRAAELVTAPSLVLFGSHDRLVSARLAARAGRAFPDARVVVLPETGHLAQMEHPDRVAALFREMVEALPAQGTTPGAAAVAQGLS